MTNPLGACRLRMRGMGCGVWRGIARGICRCGHTPRATIPSASRCVTLACRRSSPTSCVCSVPMRPLQYECGTASNTDAITGQTSFMPGRGNLVADFSLPRTPFLKAEVRMPVWPVPCTEVMPTPPSLSCRLGSLAVLPANAGMTSALATAVNRSTPSADRHSSLVGSSGCNGPSAPRPRQPQNEKETNGQKCLYRGWRQLQQGWRRRQRGGKGPLPAW